MALKHWSDLSNNPAERTVYIGVATAAAGEVPSGMVVFPLDTTDDEADSIVDLVNGYRDKAQGDGFMASLARARDGRHLAVVPTRQAGGQAPPRQRQRASRAASNIHADDAAKIRAWAPGAGYEVSPQGRLPRHVVDAYYARDLSATPAPVAAVKAPAKAAAGKPAVPPASFTSGSTS